jgi:hypothetical protein
VNTVQTLCCLWSGGGLCGVEVVVFLFSFLMFFSFILFLLESFVPKFTLPHQRETHPVVGC